MSVLNISLTMLFAHILTPNILDKADEHWVFIYWAYGIVIFVLVFLFILPKIQMNLTEKKLKAYYQRQALLAKNRKTS